MTFCDPADGQSTGCTDPERVPGGGEGTLTFTLTAPGTYNFRCDFHSSEMKGTFVVE